MGDHLGGRAVRRAGPENSSAPVFNSLSLNTISRAKVPVLPKAYVFETGTNVWLQV